MTALAGLIDFCGAVQPASACEIMLRAQAGFGPSPSQIWSDGRAAVGLRLFPLLPEDGFDQRVAVGAGGNLILAADVRLDDRDDLARALGLERERAAALSDSALLLNALERWGEAAIDRLVGVFAFALWDRRSRRLLLARDFQGHRPLHFHRGAGFFAFSSMPRGVNALPGQAPRPSRAAAAGFLLGPWPGPRESFFEGVERVPQGHFLIAGPEGVELKRWWHPPRRRLRFSGPDECQEAVRELMDRAVRAQLRGAGDTVAAQLSAGLDSSAVTATAARCLRGTGTVRAFTAVPRPGEWEAPPGRIVDEWPLAAATAAMHPNIAHSAVPWAGSAIDSLARDVELWERPVPNLSNEGWTAAIYDRVRQEGARVLLTGIAGNMTISHHGLELLPELLKSARLIRLVREAAVMRREGGGRWSGLALQALAPFLPMPLLDAADRRRGRPGAEAIPTFLAAGAAELGLGERGRSSARRPAANAFDGRVDMLLTVDHGNFNKGVLAGWGVDQRDPTGDRRLVEFTLALSPDQFLVKGEQRALARRAFADRVPESVRTELRKGHQAADWYARLGEDRDRLIDEIDAIAGSDAAEIVDAPAMRRAVLAWPDGGWGSVAVNATYRNALLHALGAGHFLRTAGQAKGSAPRSSEA